MSESTTKKIYADGDVALTTVTAGHLSAGLRKYWGTDKQHLRTTITKYLGEDALFELNWTSGDAVLTSLVTYCSKARKISDLVEAVLDTAYNSEFKLGAVAMLLGVGVIVPFAEAPIGKWKDVGVNQLDAATLMTFQGSFVNAFGTKAKVMGFVEEIFPDLSSKIDWSTIATSIASLVKYAIEQKKFGLLMEMAVERTNDRELQLYMAFITSHGVIAHR